MPRLLLLIVALRSISMTISQYSKVIYLGMPATSVRENITNSYKREAYERQLTKWTVLAERQSRT